MTASCVETDPGVVTTVSEAVVTVVSIGFTCPGKGGRAEVLDAPARGVPVAVDEIVPDAGVVIVVPVVLLAKSWLTIGLR